MDEWLKAAVKIVGILVDGFMPRIAGAVLIATLVIRFGSEELRSNIGVNNIAHMNNSYDTIGLAMLLSFGFLLSHWIAGIWNYLWSRDASRGLHRQPERW